MSASLRKVLDARRKQHGDFSEHARVTQALKDVMHKSEGWARLSPMQRESLEMNVHKIGRIIAGNPDFKDHWVDIAGYSQLIADRLTE